MNSPAVVLRSKFVTPSADEYSKYIAYVDRADAKRSLDVNDDLKNKSDDFMLYHTFMDYMGDEEKQGALFTNEMDFLDDSQKKKLREQYSLAQENESPMWQDVISFDNKWLEGRGIYDFESGWLDEEKIKKMTRTTMKKMLKEEGMEGTAVWSASIHYNTDNIHVHIATVEPMPSRERVVVFDEEKQEMVEQYRAKRKQTTLDRMKSSVISSLLDRNAELEKIDNLIRGTVEYKKEKGIQFGADKETEKLFKKALMLLPDDRRQWRYGYQSINRARPYIDKIVDIYLEKYHSEDMNDLDKKLDEQVELNKELYGEGSRYEEYKETKIEDLRKRMGNAVLTEMREYDRKERMVSKGETIAEKSTSKKRRPRRKQRLNEWKGGGEFHFALMKLRYAMSKKYHDYETERNIEEFDRMMDGYE